MTNCTCPNNCSEHPFNMLSKFTVRWFTVDEEIYTYRFRTLEEAQRFKKAIEDSDPELILIEIIV